MDCPMSLALMQELPPILIPIYVIALVCVISFVAWMVWDEIRKSIKQRSNALSYDILDEVECIATNAWGSVRDKEDTTITI